MKVFVTVFYVLCVTFTLKAAKNDGDEGRPYEFGFTIDGQQHRHEKKDVNGIIQGEFGFITADGVYHVTVYATDENGNFRILSMRNVRISAPLDGSGTPEQRSFSPQSGIQPQQPQQQALSTTPRGPYRFTTQSTIKPACAGCGYVTTSKTPVKNIFPAYNQQQNGGIPFPQGPPQLQQNNPPQITSRITAEDEYNEVSPARTPEGGFNQPSKNPFAPPAYNPNQPQTGVPLQSQGQLPINGQSPEFPSGEQENVLPKSPQVQPGFPVAPQGFTGRQGKELLPGQGFVESQFQGENPYSGIEPGSLDTPKTRLSQVSVSDGVIKVPGNPDIPIRDKYPGMVDGLPNGIEEKDVTDLLYKFNYTVGFHGHYEKGFKNGAKIGGYFVNGRDGLSRVVTYVADENGFRPKFKLIRLGLDSPDTPKEETEKTFGLKNFEFIWYPIG